MTAALADQRVDYGELVPVNGTLAGPDGGPLAGQVVEVQVNSDNAWRTSRRVTTGADGVFATDLKPAQAHVRARALPRQRRRARRGLAEAAAEPAPGAHASTRPPRRGAARRAAWRWPARWRPRKRVVTVVFQQRVRGRWRKVGTRAVRTRRGRFETSFVPAFRAAYRYYAVARSDLDTDRALGAALAARALSDTTGTEGVLRRYRNSGQ